MTADVLPTGKPATQQVWKPALRAVAGPPPEIPAAHDDSENWQRKEPGFPSTPLNPLGISFPGNYSLGFSMVNFRMLRTRSFVTEL
jgi:hypothetical protein